MNILSSLKTFRNYYNLIEFISKQDLSVDPYMKAFLEYALSWSQFPRKFLENFHLGNFLAEDHSSIFLGRSPVIFLGSNNWALKKYLTLELLEASFSNKFLHLQNFSNASSNTNVYTAIVPEKDHLLYRFENQYSTFITFEESISNFNNALRQLGINPLYLIGNSSKATRNDFDYPDSHPPKSIYFDYFKSIIAKFEINLEDVNSRFKISSEFFYGDLAEKFDSFLMNPYLTFSHISSCNTVEQVSGVKTFVAPLGSIQQTFINASPISSDSVLLLGDSHCNIYDQKKLTYYFANTFRHVCFRWKPFAVGNNTNCHGYDHVVLVTSERFL